MASKTYLDSLVFRPHCPLDELDDLWPANSSGMKQKFLQQNQQKENGAVEEKRASVGRRQSVVTNYDLADALRKTSKLLKMFSAKF